MLGDESLGYLTVIWDKYHEIFRLFIQYRKSKYNCQYHGSGDTFHTFRLEVYHQQQSVTDNVHWKRSEPQKKSPPDIDSYSLKLM